MRFRCHIHISFTDKEDKRMPERPHSRKVKVVEGTAEVKKGEKVEGAGKASERKPEAESKEEKK